MKNNKKKLLVFIALITMFLILAACNSETDAEADNINNNTTEKEKDSNQNNNNDNNDESSNVNESGLPIVNDPIEIKLFVGKPNAHANNDWNDLLVWNELEERTNINTNWEEVSDSALSERRNLKLVGGEDGLPDVFWGANIPKSDLMKYGEQGVFVSLNDLIEEHAPNIQKVFEEYPEVKKGLTFPDGHIYSLPTVYADDLLINIVGSRPWINEDWLEKLDMDFPTTTDEFYDYLKAVKETDLIGDGSGDEIPFGSTSMGNILDYFKGPFNVANRGTRQDYIDMDPDSDELRFFPISDSYRDMLEYVHKLYNEKLIEQNIYSIETDQFLANGTQGKYGAVYYYGMESAFGKKEGSKFVGSEALALPGGEQMYNQITPALSRMGHFAMTNVNENPVETIKWVDYLFSDEGQELFFVGVEDETFIINDDGEYEYSDTINDNEDGLTVSEATALYLAHPGGAYPGITAVKYSPVSREDMASVEGTEKLEPYFPDEIWPEFNFTKDESKFMASTGADIEKYVTEMTDKFIVGDEPLENWDQFVKQVESMDIDKYMKIQEQAYERFQDSE